jgi:hypothetical protein
MIKKIVFFITLAMVVGILDCAAKEYKIGDTGPAGGIVFYVREDAPKGEWRYLEAAPADLPEAEWGGYGEDGVDIGGTERRIGSGKKNTDRIVARLRGLGESGKAAQICAGYELNGYKDWFLPSRDELAEMDKSLKAKGLGNFEGYYWSSSEYDKYYAWSRGFSGGRQFDGHYKDARLCVRAIRAF